MSPRSDIRLSVPSKGVLADAALSFLAACGLEVYKPNPRQYEARIPVLPGLTVLFQHPGDIVVSVRDGSVDFGITGLDMVAELGGTNGAILMLHDALGFGQCSLRLAVPEAWESVQTVAGLAEHVRSLDRPVRVATKFPNLTGEFLRQHGIGPFALIRVEGTLEVAPAIGYADMISDLVSSGLTLRDNRMRALDDGAILSSQAVLVSHRRSLRDRPEVLAIARMVLEVIEAHLRAVDRVSIFANMRGKSAEEIAARMFERAGLSGLQGPTVSQVVVRDGSANWYAAHIVVQRDQLFQVVSELRAIGGSGVVVAPVTYIFEEEPARYRAMMEALNGGA